MSLSTNSLIYKGPWIDWSHGPVVGSTITLSQGNGGLLIAFLAIFVSAAGVSCWKILSYTLHSSRAREDGQDALHHQQQNIFRNSGTPDAAAWQFTRLMWSWRKHGARSIARTLPILLLALLNIIFFGLASIFSSEVTKAAGDEVLVRSHGCGTLNSIAALSGSRDYDIATFAWLEVNDTLSASTYSQACYGNQHNSLQCNQYARSNLPWRPTVTPPVLSLQIFASMVGQRRTRWILDCWIRIKTWGSTLESLIVSNTARSRLVRLFTPKQQPLSSAIPILALGQRKETLICDIQIDPQS
ncbi:MAG: hypothetical protein Q9222_005281 [Ikaeria aurantiellina]